MKREAITATQGFDFSTSDGQLLTTINFDNLPLATNKAGTTDTGKASIAYHDLTLAPLYNGLPVKKVTVQFDVANEAWYAKQSEKNTNAKWRKFAVAAKKLSLVQLRAFAMGESRFLLNGDTIAICAADSTNGYAYTELPTVQTLPVEQQFDTKGKLVKYTKEKIDDLIVAMSAGKGAAVSIDVLKERVKKLDAQIASTNDELTKNAFILARDAYAKQITQKEQAEARKALGKPVATTPVVETVPQDSLEAKRNALGIVNVV